MKAVTDKVNVTELHQRMRDSVKHTIRMSVAAKKREQNSTSTRMEEDLQKLEDLGKKVNRLPGRRDARLYEALRERRPTNTNADTPEKTKANDLVVQEGNNSFFEHNLTM